MFLLFVCLFALRMPENFEALQSIANQPLLVTSIHANDSTSVKCCDAKQTV